MSIQAKSPLVPSLPVAELLLRIRNRTAHIGVVGLGYVGLPLAVEFGGTFRVTGFDIDRQRVANIKRGESHIIDVPSARILSLVKQGTFDASADYNGVADCDAIVICVPSPLAKSKAPNVSYIERAAESIASNLRPGQLVVLASTTYPGTTDEVLLPLFASQGLELDRDFLLAFSPERVDPGNKHYSINKIPTVVGGCSALSTIAATELYDAVMEHVHPVSSARAAEASKLLENTFRLVNIGLVNEIAQLCAHLGIDTSEVIEAAATKPFGFMPFHPGPGAGGHCIPVDPLYLSWRARQQGFHPGLIELADKVNSEMPDHVVRLASDALNEQGKALKGARVLLLGVAYKENIDDARQSPAIPIVDRLRAKFADVSYHDSYIRRLHIDLEEMPEWRPRRASLPLERRRRLSEASSSRVGRRRDDWLESVPLTDQAIARADCIIILTKHDGVDYGRVVRLASVVIDTRNATAYEQRLASGAKVIRL